jgi:hypothetical protein
MSISQTVTAGFIDLATFDELEKYMYGGEKAITYFVADVKPATWFTLIPTVLNKNMGQAEFGQEWAASISRAGDYLVHTWLRANVPGVALTPAQVAAGATIRWTHNFAHNLIKLAAVTFNDLTAMQFDNYFLDFWSAFTVPASKQIGYNNMIGNTQAQYKYQTQIDPFTINLPLPFFFTRDSGVSLPTAALPYNEMRIQFQFRDWSDLLVYYPAGQSNAQVRPIPSDFLVKAPSIASSCNVWAEYAIVSNDERKRMGCAPRDILIEQVQTAPRISYRLGQANVADIRFSHAVKLLLFGVRNQTVASEWSNYTLGGVTPTGYVSQDTRIDPIAATTLLYENTQRLAGLPSDYYALVEPWFKAPAIPALTGYHMYSYSLAFFDIDPKGSTNYGKLTNVSLDFQAPILSDTVAAKIQASSLQAVVVAVNNNVIRISGGALGFPVL